MKTENSGTAPRVVAVCGLAIEARMATGKDTIVVYGGDQQRLAAALCDALTPSTRGIISFGVAGGLAPALRPGTCIIATAVLTRGGSIASDAAWVRRMLAAIPSAVPAVIAGVDAPVMRPEDKRALHARTGAVAVDMESNIAGQIAFERGLPFAALRVVLDTAERAVPKAALAGHRADGSTHAKAVAAALLRHPEELPAVIRLAADTFVASRALLRCRRQLGEAFALVDAGHHLLHMA